ncbi:MAG: TIGR01244 family sulfur transferase [Mesorhizobium sp.]
MDYRQIAENYAVSPQIKLEDIPAIKAAGFKSVISNRPDNEDPGQLDHETVRKAVEEAGLAFKWIPVISGQMTADNVADQAAALEELPGPVFAYCRSGTRCTNLYAGVQQLKA